MASGNSTKRLMMDAVDRRSGFSAPLPNLPEEIIAEILLRLPVKTLLKFRCVSKYWLSLISSPQFIKAHLEFSTKNNVGYHNRLVFGSGPRPAVFYTFPIYPEIDENLSMVTCLVFDDPLINPDYAIRIVGSCNGLVCVAVGRCGVVLWNPATRKSKQLPISDRNILTREYGYGYDAFTDDYKVIEFSWISRYRGVYETQVKVYSSRADSWRGMDWPGGEIFDGPGVFVGGAIHWKVCYGGDMSNWVVLAQNVTTETCLVLEPPVIVRNDAKVMLGVSGECLCASYDYFGCMDVWVMREHGVPGSWTKLVRFPYLFCMERPNYGRPKLLFVSEHGEILVKVGPDLVMYKPSKCHVICCLSNHAEAEAATYIESLLAPDFDRLACS